MFSRKSRKVLVVFVLILTVLCSSLNVFAASSNTRGKSGGPYPYKNIYGWEAGTYRYYNSSECRQLAKNLELQAKGYQLVGSTLASNGTALTWQGETVCIIMWGRSFVYSSVVSKLNDAASRNGAIIYTTFGNILTKIEFQ